MLEATSQGGVGRIEDSSVSHHPYYYALLRRLLSRCKSQYCSDHNNSIMIKERRAYSSRKDVETGMSKKLSCCKLHYHNIIVQVA